MNLFALMATAGTIMGAVIPFPGSMLEQLQAKHATTSEVQSALGLKPYIEKAGLNGGTILLYCFAPKAPKTGADGKLLDIFAELTFGADGKLATQSFFERYGPLSDNDPPCSFEPTR